MAATEGSGFDLSRPVMTTDRRSGVKSYSVLVSFGQIYSDETARPSDIREIYVNVGERK